MPGSRETKEEKHARSMLKTIDLPDGQSLFCPGCKGTSIEFVDEVVTGLVSTMEEWRCNDCGERFLVEGRLLIYVGAGKHAR